MSAPASVFQPLPGRDCGACTVCCVDLEIDDPKLQKADEVVCPHLLGQGGCGIYAERPHTCATWFCGWRLLTLSDAMRPDLSKVLLIPEMCDVPGYQKGGLKLVPIGGADIGVLLQGEIVDLTGRCIGRGIPIYLGFGAGPNGKRILVNELLKASVMAGDRTAFVSAMSAVLDRLVREVAAAKAPA